MNDISFITESYMSDCLCKLQKENRFFVEERFEKALRELLTSHSCDKIITTDEVFYRARIYRGKNAVKSKDKSFKGYDYNNSWIKVCDWPSAGRMNPEGISVIYVSTGEKTCIKEICPAANETVSIAIMKCTKNLRIVDFPNTRVSQENKKILLNWIRELLSVGYGEKDYVFTQYLAMLCKSLGYDGIRYRSKYAGSTSKRTWDNIAIFEPNNCVPVSSYLREVKTTGIILK